MKPHHCSARQQGLSLIEVMVSLTLSVFLLAGLVEVAVTNKKTYGFQQGQATTSENGRFAMNLLDRYVGLAGYRSDASVDIGPAFPASIAAGNCPAFLESQVVARNNNSTGICIRYQPPGPPFDQDCTAATPASGALVTAEFYYDSTQRALGCRIDTRQAFLVDNIAGFQITYGVDARNPAPSGEPLQLSLHTGNPANWRQIVSLRFAVLTTSFGNEAIGSVDYAFPLTSASLTTAAAGDRRLYKSFEQTVPLRNVLP
jgi:type IV pilus assembly protein PilW